jgi:hypothetical protein
MARATLSLLAEHDEPVGARRWLILPPLAVLYVPIAAILFGWPLGVAGVMTEPSKFSDQIAAAFSGPFWLSASSLVVAALGAWWVVLGLLFGKFSATVRNVFFPFADWFERRHGLRLALTGVLLLLISAGILAVLLVQRS